MTQKIVALIDLDTIFNVLHSTYTFVTKNVWRKLVSKSQSILKLAAAETNESRGMSTRRKTVKETLRV